MRVSLHLTLTSFLASFASAFSIARHPDTVLLSQVRGRREARHCTLLNPTASHKRSVAVHTSIELLRGGGGKQTTSSTKVSASTTGRSSPIDTGSKCPVTGLAAVLSTVYGTGGVIYILLKAIKRVLPIALEPFQKSAVPLSHFELGAYVLTCLWFAYVEGYKGFQLKFSPLVVKRSFTLIPGKNGTRWYHFLLAPLYSMGLIHATKKRKIVSWSVSIGVAAIVAAVKRLPYPWRNVVDAGVVAGLTWGTISILALYIKTWVTGQTPQQVDASLPPLAAPGK